jgi:hypothetical protein
MFAPFWRKSTVESESQERMAFVCRKICKNSSRLNGKFASIVMAQHLRNPTLEFDPVQHHHHVFAFQPRGGSVSKECAARLLSDGGAVPRMKPSAVCAQSTKTLRLELLLASY